MCIEDTRSKFTHHLVYIANGEVIICLQSLVLIFSMMTAFSYAKSFRIKGDHHISIKSLSKATPYSFHVCHVIFCFFFVLQNGVDMALYDTTSKVCFCDPFNMLFTVVFTFLMLVNCIFIRYWKRSFGVESRRVSYIRLFIYVCLVLIHSIVFLSAVFTRPCESFHGTNYHVAFTAWICSFIVVASDHIVLAFYAVQRYRNVNNQNGFGFNEVQLTLFLLNPISLVIGVISYMTLNCQKCTIVRSVLGPICLIVIPISLELFIMWKRDCIVDNDTDNRSLVSFSNTVLRATQTNTDAIRGSELVELEKGSSFFDLQLLSINEEADTGGLLKRLVKELSEKLIINIPLKSRFVFIRTLVSGDNEQLRQDIGCLVIEEYLCSPPSMVIASKLYITSMVMPLLERGAEMRADRVETLCSTAKPVGDSSSLSLADVESSRQFRELEKQCKESVSSTEKILMLMSCVQKGLSAAGQQNNLIKKKKKKYRTNGDIELIDWTGEAMGVLDQRKAVFKPSKEKKVPSLAILPTNCQIHVTTLGLSPSSDVDEFSTKTIVSVTFGAPAAHALGFKHGGLRNMKSTISSFNFAKASLAMQHDIIQLEFDARARESIVIGQALGAALATCIDLLTRTISQKKDAILRQYAMIGILLHSVSMLTTSGNEEAMLDDFAGAYDMLNLKLSLEPPPVLSERLTFYNNNNNASKSNVTMNSSYDESEHDSSTPIRLSVVNVSSINGKNNGRTNGGCGFGNVKVQLQVEPMAAYRWLKRSLKLNVKDPVPEISVLPVLFNLGVNEMQSVANVTGSTSIQSEINDHGVTQLKFYYRQYAEFLASGQSDNKSLNDLPQLLTELEELVELEKRDRGKLVNLLLISCYIARGLNGARTTSCKSAKDRTSVFHTLEVVRIANRYQLIDGSVEQVALDEMRGEKGVRLRNCRDNVGRARYAFNQLQLKALPAELRPPASTCNAWGKS